MRKLLVYMKSLRKEAVIAPIFKMLEATMELFVPLVVAAIIDKGIPDGNTSYLIRMTLLMVLFGVLGLSFTTVAQYFSAKVAVTFTARVRHALFAHMETLSYQELDQLGTGTLITRMTSDMNQIQNGVNLTLRLLLRSPFIVLGAMIMAFTIDVKAALIFVVAIPLLSLVVFGIMLLCIPLYRRVQQRLDKVLVTTRQNLTGVRVLRAFCKEQEQIAEFRERNEALTKDQKLVGRISALLNPLTYVMINFAIIFLIKVGAIRVETGLLTQGAVIALYNYMSQILVELIKLANLIINITKSVACGNRVQSIFEVQPTITEPSADELVPIKEDIQPAVRFRNATLRYKGAADDMLGNISFTAYPGETIGIIGGTGAGKSSLVNLIARFYDVTSGEVLVDGVNVKNQPLQALRAKVAIVPQKAILFSGTIRSNLLWGKKDATEEEMWEALRLAQAEEFVRKKPEGLDTPVAQGGKNFSGGQRQRLTIARALITHARIVILDDSASALDYATDAALRGALASLPERPCVFIVSQRTISIQHADRILVLDDGELKGDGTHQELLETCPVYQEIYYSQFKKEESAV